MSYSGLEEEESSSPVIVDYVGSASSSADQTSYTFSGVSLGDPRADRYIIVAVIGRQTTTASQINGVSIGGVAATLLSRNTGATSPVAFFGLLVPAGASATIVVTANNTQARLGIGVWAVRNNQRAIPFQSYFGINETASLTISGSVAAPGTGGHVLAIGTKSSSVAQSASWTGGTSRFNTLAEQHFTGADTPTNGSLADLSVTWTGTAGTTALGLLCIR